MVEPYLNYLSDESKADGDPSNDIERDYFGFNIDQPALHHLADDGILTSASGLRDLYLVFTGAATGSLLL